MDKKSQVERDVLTAISDAANRGVTYQYLHELSSDLRVWKSRELGGAVSRLTKSGKIAWNNGWVIA